MKTTKPALVDALSSTVRALGTPSGDAVPARRRSARAAPAASANQRANCSSQVGGEVGLRQPGAGVVAAQVGQGSGVTARLGACGRHRRQACRDAGGRTWRSDRPAPRTTRDGAAHGRRDRLQARPRGRRRLRVRDRRARQGGQRAALPRRRHRGPRRQRVASATSGACWSTASSTRACRRPSRSRCRCTPATSASTCSRRSRCSPRPGACSRCSTSTPTRSARTSRASRSWRCPSSRSRPAASAGRWSRRARSTRPSTIVERFMIRWKGDPDPAAHQGRRRLLRLRRRARHERLDVHRPRHRLHRRRRRRRASPAPSARCPARCTAARPRRVLHDARRGREAGDADGVRQGRCSTARQRLMGFGHRVYRAEDPRARVLRRTAQELGSHPLRGRRRAREGRRRGAHRALPRPPAAHQRRVLVGRRPRLRRGARRTCSPRCSPAPAPPAGARTSSSRSASTSSSARRPRYVGPAPRPVVGRSTGRRRPGRQRRSDARDHDPARRCCPRTAASAPARPRSATAQLDALVATGRSYLGTSHRQEPVRAQVGRLRAGLRDAVLAARRLRGGARQRRRHRVLGHRDVRAHRAAQPAPVVRRVLLEVRRGREGGAVPRRPVGRARASPAPTRCRSPRPGVDLYALTHNETSTGVMMPIARVEGTDEGALVAVDATSGAGGLPVDAARVRRLLLLAAEVLRLRRRAVARADVARPRSSGSPRSGRRAAGCRRRTTSASRSTTAAWTRPTTRPSLATIFLMAEQVDWMNAQGGLDWAVVAHRRQSPRALYGWAETIVVRARRSCRTRRCARRSSGRSTSTSAVDAAAGREGAARATASSTPSPTASSAATSCASRCSRRSSPTTSQALTACVDHVVEQLS